MKRLKICFGDLSWPLRIAIVMAWFMGVIYGIAFMVGFIDALLSPELYV